jgi:hypothetical protein
MTSRQCRRYFFPLLTLFMALGFGPVLHWLVRSDPLLDTLRVDLWVCYAVTLALSTMLAIRAMERPL